MPYGFSFSWRRAIGASAAKARLGRAIGVPLTRSGLDRRVGRAVTTLVGAGVLFVLAYLIGRI